MLVESGTRQHGAKEASCSLTEESGQMPIQLTNDFGSITLREIQKKMLDGYSVVKTPHVGNQHPSNLVCASLGVHLHMVSFTTGERDKNFHPHLRIANGSAKELCCPKQWTPFTKTNCGKSLEEYHQSSVKECFTGLRVTTDVEMLANQGIFSEDLLEVATESMSHLWYRRVDEDGVVSNVRDHHLPHPEEILCNIFGFNNQKSGWLVPNRAYVLFDCIMQSLESGRDVIYHLAGPQMIGYVGNKMKSISKAYDAFRSQHSLYELPEILKLHVVPVALSRFITHQDRKSSLDEVMKTVAWYESLENQEKRYAAERFSEVANEFPEFFTSIENATCMSQYDVANSEDLYLSDWMLDTPLNRVSKLHKQFAKHLKLS